MIIQQFLEKFAHYEFRNQMQRIPFVIVLPVVNKNFLCILTEVNSSFYFIIFTCSYCYLTCETTPNKCVFSYTLKFSKYLGLVYYESLNIFSSGC